MINADMRDYSFFLLGSEDDYGQPQMSATPQGSIKIAIYNLSTAIADTIKYKDATYIGLTQAAQVDDTYIIDFDGAKLKVLYVLPKGRYKQVYLGAI